MSSSGHAGDHGTARRWLFADAVLDERSLTLMVGGKLQELDPKPLEVLRYLLHHADEIVTKDELLAAVWPGRVITDSALTSCVSRLREGLSDQSQAIIRTIHGYGYRLVAPVHVESSPAARPHFDFEPGQRPPHRPNWSLVERLGTGGHGEAWLVQHDKTHERRVFKFALDESCIASLKREITVSRLLHDSLGDRGIAYARVLEWSLAKPPFFIECEYGDQGSLPKWAQARGGLDQVPIGTRLDIAIEIAEALAAAHGVDVLHKDLKPSNVLMHTGADGRPFVKLCDFGSGSVLDPTRLEALGITRMGFTRSILDATTSGTPVYFSPEVLSGQPATRQSDIYAVGVILYQLVVGDLRRPLALGWEQDVEDPLLRDDISASAAGKPQQRLTDASQLARRLRTLDARRAEHAARLAVTSVRPSAHRPVPARGAAIGFAAVILAGVAALVSLRTFNPTSAEPRSLAVLPLVNASGDREQDYFSDGVTDELAMALQQVPGLRLVPRTSTFAHRGETTDSGAVGRALGAQALLTGSVARSADRLRLAARLQNAADGRTLWSESYDLRFEDFFVTLDRISRAVVATLRLEVPDDARLAQQRTKSVAAYEAYLRAGQWLEVTASHNTRRIGFLERATTLDPEFAAAWAALGAAYLTRIHFIAPSDLVALKRGFAAAERAASLDTELIEARLTRAGLLFTPANGFAAEQSFNEAKQVLVLARKTPAAGTAGVPNPVGGPALHRAWGQIGVIYWHWGLLAENEKIARWLLASDEENPWAQEGFGTALLFQGKYQEALEWIERTPRTFFAPLFWYWKSTWALLELGRKPEAAARIDEFFRTSTDTAGIMVSMKAVLAALDGGSVEVDRIARTLRKIDRRFGHFHHTAYNMGMAYALLDRRREAIEWLEWSARNGAPCYELLAREPFLANLRNEPRFQELLEYTRQQSGKIRALGLPEPDGPALATPAIRRGTAPRS